MTTAAALTIVALVFITFAAVFAVGVFAALTLIRRHKTDPSNAALWDAVSRV